MRTELWGLRNKETGEIILEYWASSQKHKALFSSEQNAQKACEWEHNRNLEPFKITSSLPVHTAGACYCFECKNHTHDPVFGTRVCTITKQRVKEMDFCSYGQKNISDIF